MTSELRWVLDFISVHPIVLWAHANLVPRSLVDEVEGEIWPNPICITWSPVRNVTGEASAHAQHKFEAVKADFVAYNKLTTGLRHDLAIFVRISKFRCFHETKQTQNEFERFFLQLGWIRILLRQSENFSDFCKVLSQFAFRSMIKPLYTSSSARALKLPSISLLRSRFLGCHAMFPPRKRLLTSEQHSFPLFGQSQLSFHFREPCRAKFALWDLSNQRSFFIFPSHGGKVIKQQCRQWSWRSFPSHVFQGSILQA